MAHRIQFEAFGQHHDDVWIGTHEETIRSTIMEICPTAVIHSIEKIKNQPHEKTGEKNTGRRRKNVAQQGVVST